MAYRDGRLMFAGAVLGLMALAGVGGIVATYTTIKHETIQVKRYPERQCKTSSSTDSEGRVSTDTHCNWLVYTANEVFENDDNLFLLKFNSGDIANRLDPGQTYCAKVNGWRVPFLSMYRNIISVNIGACTVK